MAKGILTASTSVKGKAATVSAELLGSMADGCAWDVRVDQGGKSLWSGFVAAKTAADAMACAMGKAGAEGLSAEPLPIYEGEEVKVYDYYAAEEIAIYCGGRFALSYCYGINGEPSAEELDRMARRALEKVGGEARNRAREELAEALSCF